MTEPKYDELHEFHAFIGEKLASGESHLSPEDVLASGTTSIRHTMGLTDIEALLEAIDEIDNGAVGMDHEEFINAFFAEHGIKRITP